LARRITDRFGWAGWAVLLCAASVALTWIVGHEQVRQLTALQTQWQVATAGGTEPPGLPEDHPVIREPSRQEASPQAFEDNLPPYEDVPDVIQGLLRFAEEEKLVVQRGEYLVQPDPAGGFLRYRMTWPVKGPAPAIYRFLQSSLRAHKTLALESLRLQREGANAPLIEARIQWAVLTRNPATRAPTP
jgi:hypothetical protein